MEEKIFRLQKYSKDELISMVIMKDNCIKNFKKMSESVELWLLMRGFNKGQIKQIKRYKQ